MKIAEGDFLNVAHVRRALVEPGDVRGDVDFQNDVNDLLARLVERTLPFDGVRDFTSPSTVEMPSWLAPPRREALLAPAPDPAPRSRSLRSSMSGRRRLLSRFHG
jgi:hypothetical protein